MIKQIIMVIYAIVLLFLCLANYEDILWEAFWYTGGWVFLILAIITRAMGDKRDTEERDKIIGLLVMCSFFFFLHFFIY